MQAVVFAAAESVQQTSSGAAILAAPLVQYAQKRGRALCLMTLIRQVSNASAGFCQSWVAQDIPDALATSKRLLDFLITSKMNYSAIVIKIRNCMG